LPLDQKISLIKELAGEGESLFNSDQKTLAYLCASVIREYIDPNKAERLIDYLLPKLPNLEVVDESFDEPATSQIPFSPHRGWIRRPSGMQQAFFCR
jgi:hypothetical protein